MCGRYRLSRRKQIIEEHFGVELTSADVAEISTVGDAVDLVAERRELLTDVGRISQLPLIESTSA